MELAEHDLDQAKSTIVQRELQLKKALEDLAQLRADRDHFDQQHRIMLQEKNAMQAERDQLKAQCAAMRHALDKIYNHNEACRAAVIQYYGLRHAAGQDLPDRVERYKEALMRLLPIIEDALSWTDAEAEQFMKEWDEGKHQLSAEDEAALEKSRAKLFKRIRNREALKGGQK